MFDEEVDVFDSVEDWDNWQGPSQEDGGRDGEPYCEDEDFNVGSLDSANKTTFTVEYMNIETVGGGGESLKVT